MTQEEAAEQIAKATGLPPKAAAWTALAALHSGVFLQRQCTAWAGGSNSSARKSASRIVGQLSERELCDELPIADYPRVLHIRHKSVYRALGEADNRHRRAPAQDKAIERMLGLDYALENPSERWLPTESDKRQACKAAGISASALPCRVYLPWRGSDSEPVERAFVEKWPLALDPSEDRAVITVVAPGTTLSRLKTWRREYGPLIRAVGTAGMRPHLVHICNRAELSDKAQAKLDALVEELAGGDASAGELERIRGAVLAATEEAAAPWGGWDGMMARAREIYDGGGPTGPPPIAASAEAWISERVRPEPQPEGGAA